MERKLEDTIHISISNTVIKKAPTLFVKTRIIHNIHVKPTSPDIEEQKRQIIKQWAGTTEKTLDSLPLINVYRKLQSQLGGDRKQMLPAVEGLLTRGILKKRFPQVNAVVDIVNIVSITHLIPIGLFDFDKIHPPVELTLAVEGDQFIPIGKEKPIKLSKGVPILKNTTSIFSAVGSRDSNLTMITRKTRTILAFSWGVEGVDSNFVSDVLNKCAEKIL